MMSRLFLGFIALSIGSIGILYLYDPDLLLARYDLVTGRAGMDNMLRSTYGGLFLASAAIFALGIFVSNRRRDALAFVAIFMTGAAIGRIASILAVGAPPSDHYAVALFRDCRNCDRRGAICSRPAPE